MRKLLLLIISIISALGVYGQIQADSAKVYFRLGYRDFDPALRDNGAVMNRFVSEVKEAIAADDLDYILVEAYASPDGTNAANQKLSRLRARSIKNYLTSHIKVEDSLIRVISGGIAWKELRQLVYDTPDVPKREKVLDILDNTDEFVFDAQGRVVDGRKKQLMDLDGGRPYKWMYTHLFPVLRNAVAVSFFVKENEPEVVPESTPQPAVEPVVEETVEEVQIEPLPVEEVTPPAEEWESTEISRFALKTNLLYDAILMPDLELEYLINDRWSVSLEGSVAWWSRKSRNRFYRIATFSPEVRHWVISKDRWHGLYVGAFLGTSIYDLAKSTKGYQGEAYMAGLSVGYMWPIARHLSLEAAVGAGYMYSRYKQYMPLGDHYLYQFTKNLQYVGPLKLKLSLVWRINETIKHKVSVPANQ